MITRFHGSDSALSTERLLLATPAQVFNAFAQPEIFSQWWGPKGFRNTFEHFEFKEGGRWLFIMHGLDGTDYPNECVFREIEADKKIVIEHVVAPWFVLTINLTEQSRNTHLVWIQDFKYPDVAQRLRPICEGANEQNLDRLESILAGNISHA